MHNMGDALREAVENMTSSPSEDYYCPICKNLVPKKVVMLLGKEKTVQPRCPCEVAAHEKEVQAMQDRKTQADIERKFQLSALGQRFQTYTFENFGNRLGSERAVDIARKYAQKFNPANGLSLLMWGEPGNGKSHLAGAIYHSIKERGFITVFQSMPELLGRIRSTFRSQAKESEHEIMNAVLKCDLLILDDIGAEKISDWVVEVLFRIIDGRYRDKKPVLFTTNFTPTELLHRFMPENPTVEQEIGAKRIHDRILEMSVIVENKSSSYRREVANERARRLLEE
ncbi:ATP-binding protein [Cohnella sp. GCM10020058]|uniref:ATP-binding protein n=1 Tax=Cohnella sp. GCM10020058 TaxID=3317330 RepID=UPI00362B44EA